MEDSKIKELRVGFFIFLAIVIFMAVIFALSSEVNYFTGNYILKATFANTQGLADNAQIRLSGVKVGRVSNIIFPDDINKKYVEIHLKINKNVQNRIREDSTASIQTIGLLGDKYIEITIGSHDKPVLKDRANITAVEPADFSRLIERGERVFENLARLSNTLDEILVDLKKGGSVKNIASTLNNINDIVAQIKKGEGLLHAILYDPEGKKIVAELKDTSKNLNTVIKEFKEGGVITNLKEVSAALDDIVKEVKSGKGLAHSLIYEQKDAKILEELSSASKGLKTIIEKIDKGEGTLGLLINDPAVYDDLQTILGGAKRSERLQGVIRYTIEQNK
ncbi:MAG: MCE family protein [Nitrospirae bacterium]|nr:MCE family protein [Nitrospirota bacterium]